ncbi:MAG: PDZ domain-containing protein, partial [Atopobium sp.]|nr:PDZ domain-containing protein [Atopobium sp.]
MVAKKANEEVKLSDELTKIVDDLVSSSKSNGSISEDDIQVAIRDVDVNDDELSDLYDSLRVKGVEINKVQPNSMAAQRGLKSGDIIIGINRQPI